MKGCGGILAVIALVVMGYVAMAVMKPLNFYDTLAGMRSVVEGAKGTFAYEKDNLMVLAWQQGGKYAFVTATKDGSVFDSIKKICNGNLCDWKTMVEFVKWLEGQGYKLCPADKIPMQLTTTLTGYGTMLITMGLRSLPSMLVLPVGVFDLLPAPLKKGVQQ